MIKDVEDIQDLVKGGDAEWIVVTTKLLGVGQNVSPAQGAVRVLRGQALVRQRLLLPIVNGKTSTKHFIEYTAAKYGNILAAPGAASGEISGALFVCGSRNYYHFFANHFSALFLLNSIKGDPVPLMTVQGFPHSTEALFTKLLPIMAGGRAVEVTHIEHDDVYDIENVVFPLAPLPFLPALLCRRLVVPLVLKEAGIKDASRDLGSVKLFVRREGIGNGRHLANQSEVEAWFVARGYIAVNPGALTLEEQVILFARATHIAGVEGAALTNILFAENAKHILMIASPTTRDEAYFQNLVAHTKVTFNTVFGEQCGPLPFVRNSDYELPLARLDALENESTIDSY